MSAADDEELKLSLCRVACAQDWTTECVYNSIRTTVYCLRGRRCLFEASARNNSGIPLIPLIPARTYSAPAQLICQL